MPRSYRLDNESVTLTDDDGREFRLGVDGESNTRLDAYRIVAGTLDMPSRAYNVTCDLAGVLLSSIPHLDTVDIVIDAKLCNKISEAISDQKRELFSMGLRPERLVIDTELYAQMKASSFSGNVTTAQGLEIVVFPSPFPVVLSDNNSEWSYKDKLDSYRRGYFDNKWTW